MSTGSLLRWIALVAGAELAVRGHLASHFWACHLGVALVAIALAAFTRSARARRALVIAAAALFAIDAAWAGFARSLPPAPVATREPVPPQVPESSPPAAPGRFVIL